MSQQTIADQLSAPFDPDEVKFKPQAVKGARALAIAYVDARVVAERLDAVVGPGNWQDVYEVIPAGVGDKQSKVTCRLAIRLSALDLSPADHIVGEEWVWKQDVGGESEQPDEGDQMKAAFSDAFKRAAVKWGIGRYLYRLPQVWADFDPQKKQFVRKPGLPDWAIPKKLAKGAPRAVAENLDDKRTRLSALAAKKGADLSKTFAHYKVRALDELTAKQLDDTITALEKKEDKQ